MLGGFSGMQLTMPGTGICNGGRWGRQLVTARRVICVCVCSVKVCLYYVCMYVSINICVYMYAYIPVGMYLYVSITSFITLTLPVFISRSTFVSNVYPGTWLPLAQSQRMLESLPGPLF